MSDLDAQITEVTSRIEAEEVLMQDSLSKRVKWETDVKRLTRERREAIELVNDSRREMNRQGDRMGEARREIGRLERRRDAQAHREEVLGA